MLCADHVNFENTVANVNNQTEDPSKFSRKSSENHPTESESDDFKTITKVAGSSNSENLENGLPYSAEMSVNSNKKSKKRLMYFVESSDESSSEDEKFNIKPTIKSGSEAHLQNNNSQDNNDEVISPINTKKLKIDSSDESNSDCEEKDDELASTDSLRNPDCNESCINVSSQNQNIRTSIKNQFKRFSQSSVDSDTDDQCNSLHNQDNKLFSLKQVSDLIVEEDKSSSQVSDEESNSSDSSEDDDDAPPIRIFRNKSAAIPDNRDDESGKELSEDEGIVDSVETPPSHQIRRKSKRLPMPSSLEIKSETQRLIRESRVNLPYHIPETKKLSQFLKRPIGLQEKECKKEIFKRSNEQNNTDDKQDSGIESPDTKGSNEEEITNISSKTVPTSSSRKARLLTKVGVKLPTLNNIKIDSLTNTTTKFIDLDGDEPSEPRKEISNFMERFLKHSKLEKNNNALSKKKVQFNIIRKEERADGSGVDLVSDVVEVPEKEAEKQDAAADYKSLRATLAAKMKRRRTEERHKREELYKLDNEDIGEQNEDEDELDDEDMTDEEESDNDNNVFDNEVVDSSKNNIIKDDSEDEDIDSLEPTQVVKAEINFIPKTSPHTLQSGDSASSHLTREGSILLFDDTMKKSSCSREESLQESSIDPLYSSIIPPNRLKSLDPLDGSKASKLNIDDDSYFCSERSTCVSSSTSPLPTDFESQFYDSDGFIKEPKANKSLPSFLPPGGEDDNANDCNMSQLLELCSGKFQGSDNDPNVSAVEASTDVNGAFIDESFGFQVEPAPTFHEREKAFSDEENSNFDDDDNGITIIRRKKDVSEEMIKNFLEDEAELSGDDIGSDDDADDDTGGEDNYEIEDNDEELPKDEIIQQQVNKVHLKQLLDEDQRNIDLLQEAFIQDTVGVKRNRRFRWKNIDDNLTQDLFQSDDDVDENESFSTEKKEEGWIGAEESQWRMLRLKREEYLNSKTSADDAENFIDLDGDSQLLRLGKVAVQRRSIASDTSEDPATEPKTPSLSRSSSFNGAQPIKNSFLIRKNEILSKFANYKEASLLKGAVNSNRMVFKAVSPNKKTVRVKRPAITKKLEVKKPRIDDDSNSIFNLFEV